LILFFLVAVVEVVDLTYPSMQLCQTGYGNMRHYQHPAITGRNRLYHLDWKVCWQFFLIFCVFFRSSFVFIKFLGRFFVTRALQYFFLIIIKYMSIVMNETRFVCSRMLGTMCMVRICIRLAKEHHMRNYNKKPLHVPRNHLVNEVKLSLQSGHNT